MEAKTAAKDGVFVVTVLPDGSATFTTAKGKRKEFPSLEAAETALNEKYGNPVIIVVDVFRGGETHEAFN